MVDRGRRWRTSTPTRIGKMDHGPNSGFQGTSKVHSRSQRSFENLQWQGYRRNPLRFSLVCGVLMLVGYRVFWENLEPQSSSPSTPREGSKSDGLVRCRYHGNCPIGTICHFVDGNCHPYHYVDDPPKHRGRRDYLIERMGGVRNFDHCTRVCLEELTPPVHRFASCCGAEVHLRCAQPLAALALEALARPRGPRDSWPPSQANCPACRART